MTSAWGSISGESVWNDSSPGGATGGGFSEEFARPAWQDGVTTEAHRGVPDVAGNADPQTGYYVLVDGQKMVVGGTSAAAPLWAGLIALCNEKLGGRMGFVNPRLYEINQMQDFHDITEGDNGAFTAATGWDAATGLGTPKGIGLLQAIQTHANQAHLLAQSRMEAAAHSASAG